MRAAIAIVATFTTACATIVNGRTHEVKIASTPSGATVRISRGNIDWAWHRFSYQLEERPGANPTAVIVTPAQVMLPRKHAYVVAFADEGSRLSTHRAICRKMSWWVWGNILPVIGTIGYIVDLFSGAAWKLDAHLTDVDLSVPGPDRFICG